MKALVRVVRLGRSGRGRLTLAVLLGVLAAGAAVALAGVSAWLVARAAEQPPVLHLMVAVVAVRALGISRGFFRYLERLTSHDASFRVLGDLRVAVVRRVERLLPGDGRLAGGDLLARFTADVDGLADVWVRLLLPTAATVVVAGGAVIATAALLPPAGLVAAACLTVGLVVVPAAATWLSGRSGRSTAGLRGALAARTVTVLDGAAELTVYGRLEDELALVEEAGQILSRTERRLAWTTGAGAGAAVAVMGVNVVVALAVAAAALADGSLSGPALAVVVLLPLAVHELVALLTPAAAAVPHLTASATRLTEVLDAPDPFPEPEAPATLLRGPYGLCLRGAAVGHPDGPVLIDGLDLDLDPGEVVALVGPSGLGKSTLASTLMRFVPPRGGQWQLRAGRDTVQLDRLAGDDVRTLIGWCSQDAHIFDSTIAANLLIARPDADEATLLGALKAVQFDPHLGDRRAGLLTMVGEHGSRLSGGERQRLALARVLLADTPIVVIDEPTEHLDDEMATNLLDELLAAVRGRAVLVITHRSDLVHSRVDRVVDLSPV